MIALRSLYGLDTQFYGIGGKEMQAEGLISEFPLEELGLIGVFELIPHIRRVMRRIRELATKVMEIQPDAFIGIDCSGINMRIMKILKRNKCSVPRFQYSAPQVWAWREHRAKKLSDLADYLLCLLPFEPSYFEKYGLDTTFVGHSVTDITKQYSMDPVDETLIAVLPGSRKSEVSKLMPIFKETVQLVKQSIPDLAIVIPTVPQVEKEVRAFAQELGVPARVITDRNEKFQAFYASRAALAASGTVTLELAAFGTPAVVGYKVSPLTYFFGRRFIKTKYASLVNILNDYEVLPERIQENCTPEKLAMALIELIKNPEMTEDGMTKALTMLASPIPELSPSLVAARVIQSKITQCKGFKFT